MDVLIRDRGGRLVYRAQRPPREEGPVTTETEMGVRQLLSQGTPRGARSHQKLQEVRKDSSLSPERDRGLAHGLFRTRGLQGREHALLLSSATQSVSFGNRHFCPRCVAVTLAG